MVTQNRSNQNWSPQHQQDQKRPIHPKTANFGYMKKLFPSLFANFDVSSFKCDVCELAKSHRASFPLTLNKSPLPFMITHSDFGAHLNLLLWMDRVGLLLLLMIVLG